MSIAPVNQRPQLAHPREEEAAVGIYAASAQEHEPTDHHSMNEAAHVNCPTYDPPSPGWVRLQRTTLNICYNNTVPVATSSGPCQYCGAAIAKRAGAPTALDAVSTLYTAANAWTDPFSVAAGVVVGNGRVPYADNVALGLQMSGPAIVTYPVAELERDKGGPVVYGQELFVLPEPAPFYISNDPHGQRRWRLTCTRTEASVFLGLLLDVDTRPGTAVIIVYLNPVHTEHHRHPSLDGPATDAAGVAPAPPLDPNCFPPGPASHRAIRAILRLILKKLNVPHIRVAGLSPAFDMYVSGFNLSTGEIADAHDETLPAFCCTHVSEAGDETDNRNIWFNYLDTKTSAILKDLDFNGIAIGSTPITYANIQTLIEAFPYNAIRPSLTGAVRWSYAVMPSEQECSRVRRIIQRYCVTRPQGSHQWKAALTAALQP